MKKLISAIIVCHLSSGLAQAGEVSLSSLFASKVVHKASVGYIPYEDVVVTAPGEVLTEIAPAGAVRLDGFVGRVAEEPKTGPGTFSAQIRVNGHVMFDTGPLPIHSWRRGVRFRVPVIEGQKVELVSGADQVTASIKIAWVKGRFVDAQSAVWPSPPADTEGIAPKPPMGWNNWYSLQRNIDEKVVMDNAQRMLDLGLKDAGYTVVGLDDGWQDQAKVRDDDGTPRYDRKKFPNGIEAVADKMTARGLILGIYSKPAWVGDKNEAKAAKTFMDWHVGLIKYDYSDPKSNASFAKAFRLAGSRIIFNVCEWGAHQPWEWAPGIDAQTWRTGFDINFGGFWEHDSENGLGAYTAAERNDCVAEYAGPGHWNDPDYLEVGFKGMNNDEWQSQFGLWCLMASPLTIATDLRSISPEAVNILTNPGAIAINQDPKGVQGIMVMRIGNQEVWAKPLADGSLAVGLLNKGSANATVTCDFRFLGLTSAQTVCNVWTGKLEESATGSISRNLRSHQMALLRLTAAR